MYICDRRMIDVLNIDGRNCRLFGSERPECLLIQPSARHENDTLESEVSRISGLTKVPFALAAVELGDWMVDLMPWPDGNMSRDPEAGKRCQDTFDLILDSIVPEVVKRHGDLPVILGGYSLGGLFALWASARSDIFKAVAAASPSVWIKDWIPFAKKNTPKAEFVYLSLGDREEHVKNQAIARVGDCLREQYSLLVDQLGEDRCSLVWEEGNHFHNSETRLAKAFAWCMERINLINE